MAQVHPSRTILVSSEGAQDLVIYADQTLIKGPVTAAQIAVWNAGEKPIKAEDILEKIQIKTSNGAPLLSVRILKTTRTVNKITADASKVSIGVLDFGFQVLEKGDGALIQITYEGNDKVEFIGSGVIIGQNKFEITKSQVKAAEKEATNTNPTISKLILLAMLLAISYFVYRAGYIIYCDITSMYKEIKNGNGTRNFKFISNVIVNVIGIVVFIIMVGSVSPIIKELMSNSSPFLQ